MFKKKKKTLRKENISEKKKTDNVSQNLLIKVNF